MADNVAVTPGSGATIATDDIGGAQYQRVKLIHGADGVNDGDVSSANGLPVNVATIGGSAARTADLDLDVATDTYPVMGIAFGKLGGGVPVSDTNPLPSSIVGTVSFSTGWVAGDGASDTGDNVVIPAYVRDDALTTLTVTDGKYTQGRVDSTGALWMKHSGAISAAQSGTWVLGANSGVDIGDVTVNNAAGASAVNIQDGGNSITVDGTIAATQSGGWSVSVTGSVDTELPAAATLSDLTVNPTTPSVGALGLLFNGTSWDRVRGDTTNGIDVDVTRLPTLANVTTVATLTNITNWGNVADNAAFTDGTTRLLMGGYIFDEVAGTALTENDAAAARVDSKRAQVFALEDATTRGQRQAVDASGNAAVADKPTTAGGLTATKVVSAASTNATSVKASAGQVYTIFASNANAAIRYLKLYNKASAPTVGTDVPVWTMAIPAAGILQLNIDKGLAFSAGIAFALTTESTDAGATGVALSEIVVNIGYK